MTKSMITKTWIAGLVVLAAGLVAAVVGVVLLLSYGGTFTHIAGTVNQYNFDPYFNASFWTGVTVIVGGGVLALIGGIVQLAAWIGALVNSYMLPEKAWFMILLIGGIFSLAFGVIGFAVMIAYVIAAPDGTPYKKVAPTTLQTPTTLAPTS